jgi:hypothetical protein
MKNLLCLALLGIVSAACGATVDGTGSNDTGSLGSNESQLVEDDAEASSTDDDVEAGLDQPLSGATTADPETPASGATDDELLEKARTNPGLFFQPAGCIVSTRAANVITHVFTNCTGPYGLVQFNGTVTSTYVREPNKLTITHVADGFKINGATISGSRTIVYSLAGTVLSKTRTGDWSGTTAKGNPISHKASFVTTFDVAARCITRDGTAETTIGGRSYSRSIDGYKRCGIGRLGCPESGVVTLSRTKDGTTLTLTIEFLGGRQYKVTRPNGTEVIRSLFCRA